MKRVFFTLGLITILTMNCLVYAQTDTGRPPEAEFTEAVPNPKCEGEFDCGNLSNLLSGAMQLRRICRDRGLNTDDLEAFIVQLLNWCKDNREE